MKNIALCFDCDRDRSGVRQTSNAGVVAGLLYRDRDQLVWSTGDAPPGERSRIHPRRAALASARASVADAYRFLVREWEAGDRLYLFGAGGGAACAMDLARLLGAVGVLNADVPGWTADDFQAYVLSAYVMSRSPRDDADWQRIGRLAAALSGRADISVGVEFLGLWDAVAAREPHRRRAAGVLGNVTTALHAVAIDGRRTGGVPDLGAWSGDGAQEVWFRGAHDDVVGHPHGCQALAGITLDWIVDGAIRAGARVRQCPERATPGAVDALAGSAHPMPLRHVPPGAAVHASVASYVRAHPSYWRRLPAQVTWADPDWAARSERLVPADRPETDPQLSALATAS
ncbi:Uncharacterized conserved protein (DUF2235) [Mycolicibacterium aurum]|uniref:Uncharacterized conserved protein (DUF2235) n=1 Tax=Mycolicibacterium aurum TaxID=1791 RepID=A0A3S4SF28_MYCAU|nr:DUF2235 domain-containing protein [Mycolicibacterium aurum]VEG51894.1 Uncharacterized conserved protein (DUF2235) [Mycolicibacterium aurum]